ncbi:uncharacterized protein [Phaseolus vulgaris]|uniref:uncharacterized protein n=1 Tax=Phaseolus vulgaris TaxID=3885 RepID=UPI0035CB4BD2
MYGYYMPKPKRIKNLLKAIGGHSSDTSHLDIHHHKSQNLLNDEIYNLLLNQQHYHKLSLLNHQSAQSAQPEGTSESALPHTSESTLPHTSESTEPYTPLSAQPHTLESEAERVAPKKGRHSNHYWFVDTIDEHGVTQKMKLKVRDAHNLPTGTRVVVNYDDNFQPIGEACGLLAGVCGQLAANHILLPISFESWSFVPDTYKDTIWENALKVNEDLAKRDVMFKIGKLWREYRCKLWNEFYDPVLSRNDLIKNVPDGLNMEQWAIFVDYPLKPSTVE